MANRRTIPPMLVRPRPPSERLLTRVTEQRGAFTRRDALECGHTDDDLRAWTRAGSTVQATRGGYYRSPETEPQWADVSVLKRNTEHERRRLRAVLLVVPETFVASHESALLRHGLPGLRLPDPHAEVWLMATTLGRFVRRDGVHLSKRMDGVIVDPIMRAVSVPDAIAQTGCAHGQRAALVPADAALRKGRLDLTDLDEACRRMAGRHGCGALRGLSGLVDGRHESPGETRTSTILIDAGIRATPQIWISDECGEFARVDFLVDGTTVVIEFDGMDKYDDPEAAREEKKREHRLHRAGYVVVRVIWEDFSDIPALIRRIRAAIARAARA
jgi:hypothetical protein